MNQSNIRYVIVVAFVTAMGGFLLGFDGSVISGASPFYKDVFGLREDSFLFGFSVSCILWGGILGSLSAGAVSDRIGRKPTLLITAILFIISALLSAFAGNIEVFIFGRIIGGIAVGIAILVAPIYIAEISPSKQRGWLVSFNQLLIVIGLSAAYFSNYFILQWIDDPRINWRWMLGVEAIPAALYFLFLLLIPESPRWLIMSGKVSAGRNVLEKVYGDENADRALKQIEDSILTGLKGNWKHHLKELFTRRMRKIMTIGIGLAIFQQVSGINAILYYAPMIFESTGGGRDSAFFQATVLGAVFVVMTLVSMALIDRLGRKPLLYMGVSLMAVSLLVTGFNFLLASYSLQQEDADAIITSVFENQTWNQLKTNEIYSYQSMSLENELVITYTDGTSKAFALDTEPILSIYEQYLRANASIAPIVGSTFNSESAFKISLLTSFTKGDVDGALYIPGMIQKAIAINPIIVLFGILGFIAGFSISLGPVMWTMFSEIFPNQLRGIAISVVGTFNTITSFLVATFFPIQIQWLGSGWTYMTYAFCMVACLVFVYLFVIETKGKSLEVLEEELMLTE